MQRDTEIVVKLVNLLRSYGLDLPTDAAELEQALRTIDEMADKAGVLNESGKISPDAQSAAAADPVVRRLLESGSEVWKNFSIPVETRYAARSLSLRLRHEQGRTILYMLVVHIMAEARLHIANRPVSSILLCNQPVH